MGQAEKLRSGDPDYRAYVGGHSRYDVLAAAQFGFLVDAGLRDDHRVVDVGCGSLRLGRLLIPFLQPDRYFGVEPNEWLVREGFERELGQDIVAIKRPRFLYVDDFSLSGFDTRFDFAVAYSVLTHCYPDLAARAIRGIADSLAPTGLLLATFVENPTGRPQRGKLYPSGGTGWLYPKCVRYTWDELSTLLRDNGLVGYRVRRPAAHKQEWFVAARPEGGKLARRAARRTTAEGPAALANSVRQSAGRWAAVRVHDARRRLARRR